MRTSGNRFAPAQQGAWVAAWLALLCGWLILAWPWLSGRVTIPWDAKAQFLPQLQFLAASFAAGDSPFWAPGVFAGHPQIADPQSLIFSPPFLLLALVNPAPDAWAADATLYLLILAAAGALLAWTRDRGWQPAAGVVTALSFAFGAAMAWRVQHIGQVMSLAYLPMVLVCLDRALDRGSWRYAVAAGALAAFMVLGRDQIALLAVYLLIGHVAVRLWLARDRSVAIRAAMLPLLLASLVGGAMVALPTIWTALITATSNRPSITLEGAGHGSLHPALLLTALAPDVFASSGRLSPDYWGPPSFVWRDTGLYIAQNMGQLYIGAIPILALLWGAATGTLWAREVRYLTLAFVVTLLYALGWYTPAFAAFHAVVPGVNLYRRPADAVFVLGFLMSLLAGFALSRLLSEAPRHLPASRTIGMASFVAAAFAVMLMLAAHFDRMADAYPPIAIAIALLLLAALVLASVRRFWPLNATLATLLLGAVLVGDLAWSNGPGNATGLPPETYDVLQPKTTNDTIALLKQRTNAGRTDTRRDRVELVGFGFAWPNASLSHGLNNTLGYNPLRLGLYTRATGAGDTVGLIEQKGFSPLMPSYRSVLADLLGLATIATSAPIEQIDPALKPGDLTLVAKTRDGYVYDNPHALPRVLFATSARPANFEQMLTTGGWPDVDYRTTVLLDGAEAVTALAAGAATEKPRAQGQVRITAYGNTAVTLDADSPDGGFVVLNDVWQPWWFATVDGADAPLLRANVLFRAVAVPPGRHQVRFSFEPLRGAMKQLRGAD